MSLYTTLKYLSNTTCLAPAGQDGKHVLYADWTHPIFSYSGINYFTSADAKQYSRTVKKTVNEDFEILNLVEKLHFN